MSFEEVKEVFVDTLNCDADKVTMDASLTDDLQAQPGCGRAEHGV